MHIVGTPPKIDPAAAKLIKEHAPDIVVFGHSHKACVVWHNGALYVNPGSAGASYWMCCDQFARHRMHLQVSQMVYAALTAASCMGHTVWVLEADSNQQNLAVLTILNRADSCKGPQPYIYMLQSTAVSDLCNSTAAAFVLCVQGQHASSSQEQLLPCSYLTRLVLPACHSCCIRRRMQGNGHKGCIHWVACTQLHSCCLSWCHSCLCYSIVCAGSTCGT